MSALDGCLIVHALATGLMAGVIWFVQVVHYPMFARVGRAAFADYEAIHQRRTTWVVLPTMLVELAAAVVLVWLLPVRGAADTLPGVLAWVGLGLLALIWLSTFLVQVPCHRGLAGGFDAATHRRLVLSNWPRTAAWSARLVIALVMLRDV